ncbi:MAG: hypothetical protein NXI31_22800 [bacterium]|nr:hypothetical protein [bacterium]
MIANLLQDDPSPWLQALGRSHPVVLHLPLGLLPGMVLLEFGAAILRRDNPRGAVATLAWLCGICAALATVSGLLLAGENSSEGELVGNHKIAGIVLSVVCVLAAVASCFQKRTAFRVLLLVAFAVMVPTGHLGGSITHGEDFLFEPFDQQKPPQPADTPDSDNTPPTAAQSEFQRVIEPILERTCTKCHNPDKTKGELLLTTKAGILAGGEYGPVIVPGNPDESPLLQRCLLPIDDDEHMPPEGKPQPTESEIEALRQWIAGGAKFE